jgi:hypothetical protein
MTLFGTALRDRVTEVAEAPRRSRRAVLRLSGLTGVPAQTVLQAADDVRKVLQRLGIEDVQIEVVPQEETAPEDQGWRR